MAERRPVSNEEFRLAYYNPDNRNIIKSVLRRYRGTIPRDDLQACGDDALWKTLQYHLPRYGQKFTTSLYRFTHWECLSKLHKLRKHAYTSFPQTEIPVPRNMDQENLEHLRDGMSALAEPWMQVVLEQRFFLGWTLEAIGEANGYCKETARKNISRAIAALKQICCAEV